MDKPKFGGPGRLKQKCIERRCILERHQDLELRREKERKSQNRALDIQTANTTMSITSQLASQIASFKDMPKPLLNQMTDALKRQQQQLQQQLEETNSSPKLSGEALRPVEVTTVEEDEDVEVEVDDS